MYAIENDLGRFEAGTEKEAKRLLRAAQAKAKKREAALDVIRKQSQLDACYNGFRLLNYHAQGDCPPAWIYYAEGENYFRSLVRKSTHDYPERVYFVSTPHGSAEVRFWGDDIVGCVIDGGGWPIALMIRDTYSNTDALYAFGAAADADSVVCHWTQLFGLPVEWFRRSKHVDVA